MKILFYLLVYISITSCKSETKPFLDFDQIDYYSLNISDLDEERIRVKEIKSNEDKNFLAILDGYVTVNLNNDSIINKIESTNYFKLYKVPNSVNTSISELFSPYSNSQASFFLVSSLCAHAYRDILVFEKNEDIVGIAFVCFYCDRVIYYSKNGEQIVNVNFKELEKVLNKLKN